MRWFWLSIAVVIVDQLSKLYISGPLMLHLPMEITSWLNIISAKNYGAAFSFLGDAGGWQRWFFVILSSVVSVVIAVWLIRLPKSNICLASALSLILGGAIGNLIDRAWYGYVIDFIDFHVNSWEWHYATFNIADSAIFIGAILMLIDAFFLSTDEQESS